MPQSNATTHANPINPTIKAVVFDLGGVLSRADHPTVIPAWEAKLGLQPGDLNRLVWDNPFSMQAFRGECPTQQVWAHVQQELQLDGATLQALQQDIFADSKWDMHMLEHLRGLKATHKLGVISDAWIEARGNIREVIHEALFDALVFSAEEGTMKPNPRMYHKALTLLQVQPREAVFVDNQIENVEGARAVGMHGILFESPSQTLADLDRLLGRAGQVTGG